MTFSLRRSVFGATQLMSANIRLPPSAPPAADPAGIENTGKTSICEGSSARDAPPASLQVLREPLATDVPLGAAGRVCEDASRRYVVKAPGRGYHDWPPRLACNGPGAGRGRSGTGRVDQGRHCRVPPPR